MIGSLQNQQVPRVAETIRSEGYDVFDDWHAAGPTADEEWRRYEIGRGHTYEQALGGEAARHVFQFDLFHLNAADIGVLVYPAGRSGHLELGYLSGQGKPCYILLDTEYDRWDVMLQFATGGVFSDVEKLLDSLKQDTPSNATGAAAVSGAEPRRLS